MQVLTRIRHFSAPRPEMGMRARNSDSVYFASHNLLYITLKHTRGVWRALALAYAFTVGGRQDWGLLAILFETLHLRFRWWREWRPAFRAKFHASRAIFQAKSSNLTAFSHLEEPSWKS